LHCALQVPLKLLVHFAEQLPLAFSEQLPWQVPAHAPVEFMPSQVPMHVPPQVPLNSAVQPASQVPLQVPEHSPVHDPVHAASTSRLHFPEQVPVQVALGACTSQLPSQAPSHSTTSLPGSHCALMSQLGSLQLAWQSACTLTSAWHSYLTSSATFTFAFLMYAFKTPQASDALFFEVSKPKSPLIALHVVSHLASTSSAASLSALAAWPNAFTVACALTLASSPLQLVGVPLPSVALQPAPATKAIRPTAPTVANARFKVN
jgi:hypothetical protein